MTDAKLEHIPIVCNVAEVLRRLADRCDVCGGTALRVLAFRHADYLWCRTCGDRWMAAPSRRD